MKILLVSEDIPSQILGGLGKHVVALGNALIAAGHEVALMGRDFPSYAECAVETGFHGHFIPGFGNPLKGWKETQLGFFNPWKRPYFARRLAKAILAHADQFDVIHYHGHQPMVGRFIPSSVHFVQTRHDQGGDCITNVRFRQGDVCRERDPAACARCIHPNPGALRTALSAMAVQRYRAGTAAAYAMHPVIFVSDFLRCNYRKTLPTARLDRSMVIHNFVDEAALAAEGYQTSAPVRQAETRIHVAGRLDEPKGIAAFLDLLAPRLPAGWRVNVYGDGPLRGQIEARHARPDGAIHLHGHRLYRDIVLATRSATAVVVPSVCEESCGTVILEALRLGKPCYALARGGTPELIRYGRPGQLRLFADLPALVEGLVGTREDFSDESGGVSADVQHCMLALLQVYAQDPTSNAP